MGRGRGTSGSGSVRSLAVFERMVADRPAPNGDPEIAVATPPPILRPGVLEALPSDGAPAPHVVRRLFQNEGLELEELPVQLYKTATGITYGYQNDISEAVEQAAKRSAGKSARARAVEDLREARNKTAALHTLFFPALTESERLAEELRETPERAGLRADEARRRAVILANEIAERAFAVCTGPMTRGDARELARLFMTEALARWQAHFATGAWLHHTMRNGEPSWIGRDAAACYFDWVASRLGGEALPAAERAKLPDSAFEAGYQLEKAAHLPTGGPRVAFVQGDPLVIRAHGGDPVMIDPSKLPRSRSEREKMYNSLDRVLLFGGPDIPFCYYDREALVCDITPRDAVEHELCTHALEQGKPIFGICRGLQMLNAVAGGTLIEDIDRDYLKSTGWGRHRSHYHNVLLTPSELFPEGRDYEIAAVQSVHHQAMGMLASGLHAVGWSPDGVVEVVSAETADIAGVQFHPERMPYSETAKRLMTHAVRGD